MDIEKRSWERLPTEIKLKIMGMMTEHSGSVANYALVCRSWQGVFEAANFARIRLTTRRLDEFRYMPKERQRLVKYLWMCIELQDYDCSECKWSESSASNHRHATIIEHTIRNLFGILTTWGNTDLLQLDISIHSNSDSQHRFKYIRSEPDVTPPLDTHQTTPSNDPSHDWENGSPWRLPPTRSVHRLFEAYILSDPPKGPLPQLPVVTSLLLRRQTRRVCDPYYLRELLECLPGLRELYYEPWKRLDIEEQKVYDSGKASRLCE